MCALKFVCLVGQVMAFPCIVALRGEPPVVPMLPLQPLVFRAAWSGVLRQTFKYDPNVRKKAEAEGLVSDDVIRLAPFLVNEKKVSSAL